MTTSTDKFVDRIVGWLECERSVYLTASRKVGIEPSVEIEEMSAINITETGIQSYSPKIRVSAMSFSVLVWEIETAIKEDSEVSIKKSPAQDLYNEYGDKAKTWSMSQNGPVFEDNPPKWIYENLLSKVKYSYLAEIKSLESAELDLAKTLAKDLVDLFEADTIELVTALPLGGIKFSEDPIGTSNVIFRTMSPNELGRFLQGGNTSYPLRRIRRELSLSVSPGAYLSERWVLETRTKSNKLEQPLGNRQAHKIVIALQLLGFDLKGRGFIECWTEPGPTLISMGQGLRLLKQGGDTKTCSRTELERALSLADKIQDGSVNGPTDTEELVVHRFHLGATNPSKVDSLVDYVIALEGFLLPDSNSGEYRFKFSLFGAHYLGYDKESRSSVFKDLQKIYDARSKIVHGSSVAVDVAQVVTKARELTGRIIVKALEEGWPSKDSLSQAALN